jgi:uncharacterized protein (DUF58 family)
LGLGQHLSRSRGAGVEFEQYRAYEYGDEPRRVDWKLYGRSDRFFVRDATRESPRNVWVLVDATASMAQSDARRPEYSKLGAAKLLSACLAEIAAAHGDSLGLIAIGGAGLQLIPAGSGRRHRDRLLLALEALSCGGSWPASPATLRPVWERIEGDSLVVFISDGFDAALPEFALRLAAARRHVLSLGLVSCEERDFPFEGGFVFRDPETGAECSGARRLSRAFHAGPRRTRTRARAGRYSPRRSLPRRGARRPVAAAVVGWRPRGRCGRRRE